MGIDSGYFFIAVSQIGGPSERPVKEGARAGFRIDNQIL
jgi:hypothetical protein